MDKLSMAANAMKWSTLKCASLGMCETEMDNNIQLIDIKMIKKENHPHEFSNHHNPTNSMAAITIDSHWRSS